VLKSYENLPVNIYYNLPDTFLFHIRPNLLEKKQVFNRQFECDRRLIATTTIHHCVAERMGFDFIPVLRELTLRPRSLIRS
jgi:hypothetical protein